jgi:hypothetical protein
MGGEAKGYLDSLPQPIKDRWRAGKIRAADPRCGTTLGSGVACGADISTVIYSLGTAEEDDRDGGQMWRATPPDNSSFSLSRNTACF